jgi:putative membrane-bound dehydrogenase-like protein
VCRPLVIAIALVASSPAFADDLTFPRVPPTPPDKAEATFETLHGFRMELIAAEPLVASPVDMAIDEEGRAYVVEMRDYPYPEEKNAEPMEFPGTVRLLEDEDGDGKFEKSTVFADQLAWPTSVCCYKGGVFVAAAPDIWYFKDTDGNRKADVRRKVFTGFSRYNVQAIMNSLRWGLDNKIYGSASGNGGTIRHAERPDDPLIQLTRRDFRFDPVTEKLEAIAGGERFGACFDDWGNRFLCNIRNPVQHVVLPLEYVQRNPHLVVPSLIHDCAESGDQLRVFRLSPPEPWRLFRAQRWSLEGVNFPRSELIGAGFWTSSSGVCVYRGAAYPEPFRGNVFIGEVAGNLVHRQLLERDGVTFKSRRADENTEFVRSRDNWFRPVNFINAPDGTLHVLDMYRETIEHPWSIPDDIKAQLDLSSGNDRGRLYRLAPPGFTAPKPPRLSQATTAELVAHLESPHGWWRETAQRLLFERQDKAAVPLLKDLLRNRTGAYTRASLHAMWTLNGMGEFTPDDIAYELNSGNAMTRLHAIRIAEPLLRGEQPDQSGYGTLATQVAKSKELKFPPLDLQLALTAGAMSIKWNRGPLLIDLVAQNPDDPWIRAAVLSSAGKDARHLIPRVDESRPGKLMLAYQAAEMVGAQGDAKEIEEVLILIGGESHYTGKAPNLVRQQRVIAGLADGCRRRGVRLSEYVVRLTRFKDEIDGLFADAALIAANRNASTAERIGAIELVKHTEFMKAQTTLFDCLNPDEVAAIRQAAVRSLASFNESEVAPRLVARWKELSPPLRDEAVGILLSRPIWHEALVGAIEKGEIPAGQISIPHRQRLAALGDTKLAERAKAALAAVALGPRKEMIEKYQGALSLKGDGERGKIVYRRECMNCHKLAGEGHDVGPSLETVQHRSPQEILIHVLDPSREVSPQFLDYAVRLTDGRVVTGMIAGETDAGLTLRRAEKQEESILRSEIDEITSSGKSLMPDGMEQKIKLEEMADLIAYLLQATLAARKK